MYTLRIGPLNNQILYALEPVHCLICLQPNNICITSKDRNRPRKIQGSNISMEKPLQLGHRKLWTGICAYIINKNVFIVILITL